MSEYLLVKNWSKFQHYKDRNPPWIKLHFGLLASKDWVMSSNDNRSLMIAIMLIASQNEGKIPNDPEYIKRVCYFDKVDFKPLIDIGFVEYASNCKQMLADASSSSLLCLFSKSSSAISPDQMVELWNKAIDIQDGTAVPKVEKLTPDRRKKCIARIDGCKLDEATWKDVLNGIHLSDWLSGRKPSPKHPEWRATFDYVIRNDTIITRILEDYHQQEAANVG